MAETKDHLIGLLLGAEEDWPQAFEQILRFVGPVDVDGTEHRIASERLTIEPFDLTDPVRTGLVIDRLAHWYFHPREWLKKAALVNGTYLLNSPFTFQSMEKHSAYCAMIRLGLKVPPTILVPYKNPIDNHRWTYTSEKYNEPFDLDVLAAELGYPLYMKPFDGGGWRGVSPGERPARTCTRRTTTPARCSCTSRPPSTTSTSPEPSRSARDHGDGLPARAADAPAVRRQPRLPRRVRRQAGRRDQPHRQRLLPLGVQLRGDAGGRRRGLPDRLRQCLPGRRGDQPSLLLPLGDQCAGEVVDVLPGHRPPHQPRPRDGDVLRDRRLRPHATTRSSTPTSRSPTRTSRPSATTTGAASTSATSTRPSPSGSPAPTSTGCWSRPCRRRTRAHEQEQFLAHFRGLIGMWVREQGDLVSRRA